MGCVNVTYNAPLKRYFMTVTDGTKMWICYSGNYATNKNGENIKPNPPDSGYGMVLQEIELLPRA